MSDRVTAIALREALARRYQPPEWIIAHEVRNATGYTTGRSMRYADTLALSLWPTRGIRLIGVEIKVDKADFARELRQPEKADAIQRYCDAWYVCVPKGLVTDLTLLPPTWGLLEFNGRGLLCTPAKKTLKPKAWTRPFIASFVRNLHDALTAPRDAQNEADREALREEGRQRYARDLDDAQKRVGELESKVRTFVRGTGLSEWDSKSIIANKLAMAGKIVDVFQERTFALRRDARLLIEVADAFDQAKETLKACEPTPPGANTDDEKESNA